MVKSITKRVRKPSSKKVAPVRELMLIASPEAFAAADEAKLHDADHFRIDQDFAILDDEQPEITPLGIDNVEVLSITEELSLEREIEIAAQEEVEAIEAALDEGTIELEPEGEHEAPAPVSFRAMRDQVDADTVTVYRDAAYGELNDRAAYERQVDPLNDNIHSTLQKVRASLDTEWAGRTLAALDVNPSFINRQVNAGARYNVYALQKLTDLLAALSGNEVTNKINRACMKSLFRCRAAGVEFTGELAKAAASDKIRIEQRFKDLLVRHTVSAGTAPTQSSSTMTALQTLGVVENVGSKKAPIYRLTDHPAVQLLEEKLAA